MKFYAVALGLLALAVPAKADDITISANLDFASPTQFENFQTSFQWDNVAQKIVPNSMITESAGTFGTFSFLDFVAIPNFHRFDWTNPTGDDIGLYFTLTSGLDPHYIPGANLDLGGGMSLPLNGGGISFGPLGQSATPTPEPSSLILLGMGLISATFFMRRKLISSIDR